MTQNPDIETSRELLNLVNIIAKTDKESFCGAFNEWYEKYRDVVNERVHDKRIKRITPPYMRPKLRSAYLSIKRDMPLHWTFYDHPETGLPNTNNALEAVFSDLKTKVRVHRGPQVKITKLRKSLKIRHFSDFSFALFHRKSAKY